MTNREPGEDVLRRRFQEMARRCMEQERCLFTDFLSPAEAQWALAEGRRSGACVLLNGGYEEAERVMACFAPEETAPEFPIAVLELRWPRQSAPSHRDLLGSAMGLGLQRRCLGDIAVEPERAVLFCSAPLAQSLCDGLVSAGRVRLQTAILDEAPALRPAEGREMRDTVASPRLDAIVAAACKLSRAKAAELISSGHVKLRHLPTLRPDAQVAAGDAISIRGFGRIRVKEIGSPTRKGRYPLLLLLFGEKRIKS